MVDLLPPNATELERALDGLGQHVEAIPLQATFGSLKDPATAPAELLPWLAWERSVDVWDNGWPVAQKRAVIAAAPDVHRRKGTVGAVKRALAALGYAARLIEWHQEGGAPPYTFRLEVEVLGRPITDQTYNEVERTAFAAKNARSHLTGIRAVGRVEGRATIGAATLAGDTLTVLPWSPGTLTAQAPAPIGAGAVMVDCLTVWPEAA